MKFQDDGPVKIFYSSSDEEMKTKKKKKKCYKRIKPCPFSSDSESDVKNPSKRVESTSPELPNVSDVLSL